MVVICNGDTVLCGVRNEGKNKLLPESKKSKDVQEIRYLAVCEMSIIIQCKYLATTQEMKDMYLQNFLENSHKFNI